MLKPNPTAHDCRVARQLAFRLSFDRIRTGRPTVESPPAVSKKRRVLDMIFVLVRALALACRGHHELVLENLSLRQQLNALKRTATHPRLRRRDRLFWIPLCKTWRHWRTALVLVQPDTVVRWHREWVRR